MPPKILAVVGPTASGKTALGVALAKALNGEVVSADSMQVYRRMDIGTAKPTPEEMDGVPHHMLDVAEPEEDFSVARYVEMAAPCVDDILARGRLPILVGGTGLYVDSLLSGRTFAARAAHWREILQARLETEGIGPLLEELHEVDPETAEKLHPADTKRILRALEVWHETGKTITEHNRETQGIPPRYDALVLGLSFEDRSQLRRRIDLRVDGMMARGLADEVRSLLASGVSLRCTSMQAIGYKEMAAALTGGGDTAQAAEEIKLRSRQYAKRQLTWFRRRAETKWILSPDGTPDPAFALSRALSWAAEFGIAPPPGGTDRREEERQP